jgi:hypothetical protein
MALLKDELSSEFSFESLIFNFKQKVLNNQKAMESLQNGLLRNLLLENPQYCSSLQQSATETKIILPEGFYETVYRSILDLFVYNERKTQIHTIDEQCMKNTIADFKIDCVEQTYKVCLLSTVYPYPQSFSITSELSPCQIMNQACFKQSSEDLLNINEPSEEYNFIKVLQECKKIISFLKESRIKTSFFDNLDTIEEIEKSFQKLDNSLITCTIKSFEEQYPNILPSEENIEKIQELSDVLAKNICSSISAKEIDQTQKNLGNKASCLASLDIADNNTVFKGCLTTSMFIENVVAKEKCKKEIEAITSTFDNLDTKDNIKELNDDLAVCVTQFFKEQYPSPSFLSKEDVEIMQMQSPRDFLESICNIAIEQETEQDLLKATSQIREGAMQQMHIIIRQANIIYQEEVIIKANAIQQKNVNAIEQEALKLWTQVQETQVQEALNLKQQMTPEQEALQKALQLNGIEEVLKSTIEWSLSKLIGVETTIEGALVRSIAVEQISLRQDVLKRLKYIAGVEEILEEVIVLEKDLKSSSEEIAQKNLKYQKEIIPLGEMETIIEKMLEKAVILEQTALNLNDLEQPIPEQDELSFLQYLLTTTDPVICCGVGIFLDLGIALGVSIIVDIVKNFMSWQVEQELNIALDHSS